MVHIHSQDAEQQQSPRLLTSRVSNRIQVEPNRQSTSPSWAFSIAVKTQRHVRTILEDPELSQAKVYRFFEPIVAFFALLLATNVVSHIWDVMRIVEDAPNQKMSLVLMAGFTTCFVFGCILAFRGLLWVVGNGARMYSRLDLEELTQVKRGLNGEVFGGMCGL